MSSRLKLIWSEYLEPMFRRPRRLQVAALCFRDTGQGRHVLLVTSRGTGRWVLPKGWPMAGKTSSDAAMQEAWEEAGVRRARLVPEPVGSYGAQKVTASGWSIPVTTLVYALEVEEIADDFPEAHERRREWFSPADAADRVHEPELREILRSF
ncbi:NUDIX hydrolase [Sulfitobacter sp. LCG007]